MSRNGMNHHEEELYLLGLTPKNAVKILDTRPETFEHWQWLVNLLEATAKANPETAATARLIVPRRASIGVLHCRSTPELHQLQAHLSVLMTYRVATGVLQHLLPVTTGRSPETLRSHTLRIGEQLGTAAAGEPTAVAAAITVSLDSTFIRSREEGERHLGVRVGNVETAGGVRQVFGAVANAGTDISALIRLNLGVVNAGKAVWLVRNTRGFPV